MIGKALAVTAALLISTQLHAQTNQPNPNTSPGVTSGPAAGSPASMRSPQAGPLETKHQQKAIRNQSQSVRNNGRHGGSDRNDQTGATGSSTPPYTSPPR
jgi:hypothetical protein